ncbi:hypothetical protein CXG81DRAFT_28935 [Caulochytrium protostelioides]|uniref:Uncharacterized protein n=1 Tax=Caulochytrium protostelioides TaxID=1555241 RepID=A0A4P9WZY8_9FUNG|nr:hypothetical protein CXG81DRAFT_28935 [Caulochytrium protostelioides]|eukprot:RKO98242.1 hypothetical protein CXG81DRAFT_28935 [Caulochytrium protostelioides]
MRPPPCYLTASIVLSGMLERCFDGVEDVMAAERPDLTNLNFYQKLMLGVAGIAKPDVGEYRDYSLLAAKWPTQQHLGDGFNHTTPPHSLKSKDTLSSFVRHAFLVW